MDIISPPYNLIVFPIGTNSSFLFKGTPQILHKRRAILIIALNELQ